MAVFVHPFGVLIIFNTVIPLTIVVIFFGLYLLLTGVIKAIDAVLLWQERKPLFAFHSSKPAVFKRRGNPAHAPWEHISVVFTILAIYLLILGSFQLAQAIDELIPNKTKQKGTAALRFPLPAIMEALVPFTVQCRVNRHLARAQTFDELKEEIPPREEGEPGLEVFIHVAMEEETPSAIAIYALKAICTPTAATMKRLSIWALRREC